MITVYGIKTCDSVRKALKWLQGEGIEHRFHDFRRDGLDAATVERWVAQRGWEAVLNKRSTTWKALLEAEKQNLNAHSATALMVAQPTLVKRPVFESDRMVLQGFSQDVREKIKK